MTRSIVYSRRAAAEIEGITAFLAEHSQVAAERFSQSIMLHLPAAPTRPQSWLLRRADAASQSLPACRSPCSPFDHLRSVVGGLVEGKYFAIVAIGAARVGVVDERAARLGTSGINRLSDAQAPRKQKWPGIPGHPDATCFLGQSPSSSSGGIAPSANKLERSLACTASPRKSGLVTWKIFCMVRRSDEWERRVTLANGRPFTLG
jgi:hypothetical protein